METVPPKKEQWSEMISQRKGRIFNHKINFVEKQWGCVWLGVG